MASVAVASLSSAPARAADAPSIAFVSNRDGSAQIYVMNADGSGQTRVTNSVPSDDMAPSWSPDGKQLVFSRGHPYQSGPLVQASVVVVNLDGTDERVLADEAGINFKPVWSPDGAHIAYVHGPATATNGPFDLWLMNADGSAKRALTTTADATQPAWSPDGTSLVFSRGVQLYVMTVATGAVRALPPAPAGADYTPSWAPGSTILFTSTRDGAGKQVYVMNSDGTHQRRLTDDGAEDKYPASSPDGRRVLFSHSTVPCTGAAGECSLTQLGGFEIFAMNADGSGATALTSHTVPETQFGDGYPVWRPTASLAAAASPTMVNGSAAAGILPRTT